MLSSSRPARRAADTQLNPDHVREVALHQTWLAESYARSGDQDTGRVLGRARALATRTRSARLDTSQDGVSPASGPVDILAGVGDIDVLSFGAGTGPGLVVLPGNFRRAHHYTTLAQVLATSGPVHVVERRGRGASGLRRPDYSIEHEVDDALQVLDATGSTRLFGHSYGGLIALHVGLRRKLELITAYEPGVMFDLDWPWLPEFTRLVDAGRSVPAMTVFLRGAGLVPVSANAPTIVFRLLAMMLCHAPGSAENRELIPTMPAELAEVARLASDGNRYAAVDSPTVLLGGSRSPTYVTRSLTELPRIMPDAHAVMIDGLDHNAPDENAPDAVARHLLEVLTGCPRTP